MLAPQIIRTFDVIDCCLSDYSLREWYGLVRQGCPMPSPMFVDEFKRVWIPASLKFTPIKASEG